VHPVDVFVGMLTAARMVVLQLQPPHQALLAAAGYAQRGGGRVVLDGAPGEGPHRDALLAAAVLRADTHEAELLTGISIGTGDDAIRAGWELLHHGLDLVVLGAGESGNAVMWDGGATVLPLLDVEVVERTGAGDAFTAGLVAGLLRGANPQEAGRLGTAAAALSVGELGAARTLTQQGLCTRLDALVNLRLFGGGASG
jgi:ribokinase